MGFAFHSDLPFLHGLKESGLGAGRGAVDLVGQNDLGEYGAWSELEFAAIPSKDVSAHDVRRKEIGRELNAFEGKS
jgi:hypothetical protein